MSSELNKVGLRLHSCTAVLDILAHVAWLCDTDSGHTVMRRVLAHTHTQTHISVDIICARCPWTKVPREVAHEVSQYADRVGVGVGSVSASFTIHPRACDRGNTRRANMRRHGFTA